MKYLRQAGHCLAGSSGTGECLEQNPDSDLQTLPHIGHVAHVPRGDLAALWLTRYTLHVWQYS